MKLKNLKNNKIYFKIYLKGKGAVIGANSLVNKNIDPYTINVGSPTKVIGKRK